MQFRHTSNLSHSVTSLVYSMFFPRNSSFSQTILLRVNSMRFLCYSQPFESFLRQSYTFQFRDWSTLLLSYHHCATLFLWLSSLCNSFDRHYFSLHFHSIIALGSTLLIHYRTDHCRYPLSQSLSLELRTNRLNRSCCSQVSDSLAVYSSHRGNLCIRY